MGLRLDNGRTSRQNNRRAMLRDLELTACSRARLGNTQFPSAGAATIQGVSMGLRLDNGRKSRQNDRRAMRYGICAFVDNGLDCRTESSAGR